MDQSLLEPNIKSRFKRHKCKVIVFSVIGLLFLVVIGQLLYPSNRLLPFTVVDGVNLSEWQKSDAIKKLDSMYADKTISVYFGQVKKAYRSPVPSEIGLTISDKLRINAIDYPWYLRIIPMSILWAHYAIKPVSLPVYQRNNDTLNLYISKELGDSCNVKSQDASLSVSGATFEIIPSQNGGTCDVKTVYKMLSEVKLHLGVDNRVTIPFKEIEPNVSDESARQLRDRLLSKISTGVTVSAAGLSQTIPAIQILSWMDFSVSDGQLTYTFNSERASTYLNQSLASKVAVSPGTTVINTYNFLENSRVSGVDGKQLDIDATLGNIKLFIDGVNEQATVATKSVAPKLSYIRSYSSTDVGLSALIQQYTQTHSGVYGVSMIELSGQNRRASYNDTQSFTTASTYKLFVAYSTLKRIEGGSWHWGDQITSTKNLSVCFDDMITKSDNTCGAALLAKVGYSNVTNEAQAIGCINTSFLGSDGIKTTAADLSMLLAELQTGQILTQQSDRDRLINDMENNIYRQGIPAGINYLVADKVGFLNNLLHDASIVYSPTGTYVLVIMTDGSSWSTIADLASQIEALRIQ